MTPRLLALFTLCCAVAGCHHNATVVTPPPPDTARARQENNQAYDLIRQEKYRDALARLNDAVAADPSFGPARNNLGLVLFNLGDRYNAAKEFEAAIALMRNQPDPLNNLGLLYESLDRLTDAVYYYDRARKLDPDNPEYLGKLLPRPHQAGPPRPHPPPPPARPRLQNDQPRMAYLGPDQPPAPERPPTSRHRPHHTPLYAQVTFDPPYFPVGDRENSAAMHLKARQPSYDG